MPDASDTALGDWYVNRLVVDRQPLLLLVSSLTLLPIVVPARDVRHLPEQLPLLVRRRLQRCDLDPAWLNAEIAAMTPVVIAKTASRSVLGVMNDFVHAVPFYLPADGWDPTSLPFVEGRLSYTPLFTSRASRDVVYPATATPELLRARWAAD